MRFGTERAGLKGHLIFNRDRQLPAGSICSNDSATEFERETHYGDDRRSTSGSLGIVAFTPQWE